jgi:hypothetical protein
VTLVLSFLRCLLPPCFAPASAPFGPAAPPAFVQDGIIPDVAVGLYEEQEGKGLAFRLQTVGVVVRKREIVQKYLL